MPLTPAQATAITIVVTPLLVFAQNLLESSEAIPALMKYPAASVANPNPASK